MAEEEDQQGAEETGSGGSREQRRGEDRRRHMIPPLHYLIAGGQRRAVRRGEDRRRIVLLDRYSPQLFVAIIGILCLSLVDAVLTLYLVEHGSTELNPVMDYFLEKGPVVFTVAKYILTSFAVVVFVVVANSVVLRSKFRAQKLFRYALIAFGSVILWELVLVVILASRA